MQTQRDVEVTGSTLYVHKQQSQDLNPVRSGYRGWVLNPNITLILQTRPPSAHLISHNIPQLPRYGRWLAQKRTEANLFPWLPYVFASLGISDRGNCDSTQGQRRHPTQLRMRY